MSGSVGDSGDGGIGAAQSAMMSQYEQETVQDMQKEAEFSKMQGEASIGNTVAKANPTS